MVAAVAAAVLIWHGWLVAPAAGFSEGLKAVARVGEDEYYASHHDGNAIV